jgi:hypothetical protein
LPTSLGAISHLAWAHHFSCLWDNHMFLQQHSHCKMVSKIHQFNQCKKLKHLPWRKELHKG